MTQPLEIEYYSDVLCVWAWIAERRNRALLEDFGEAVSLHLHYLDLFSDTVTRIGAGWADKGGYPAFCHHVREAAEPYSEAPVHEAVWSKVRPSTSANAHLAIRAANIVSGPLKALDLASHLRAGFFERALDIGLLHVNLDLAAECQIEPLDLREVIDDGRAIADLLADNKRAHDRRVAGSPTWIANSGRQILYGNVGYRVLHANVEELLRRPEHEASWC